ncbi:MAG: transglycosylase SLT domain-containing protein [Candidatus Rokubacteria bacterium]|nr:transglycosylase SLT domain-containing protein [Candidatus Rokubacteria bacterium]
MLSRYRDTIRAWTDPIGHVLWRLHLRPNHLTLIGFGVSLLAAAAFVAGRTQTAGVLLFLAGLFDFFDGSLARASGQVTPFGAFLDSVIDRYSDLVVLLGIVVLFARTPHTRGALVAMAGLVGSIMVSYTRARAQSIGVTCNVGFMERPERMICLIAGAVLDLLEPALWVLAILANLTALQRIAFTWRSTRGAAILRVLVCGLLVALPGAAAAGVAVGPETERAWARAVEAYQAGDADPAVREFGAEGALGSPIGDYARWILADALARRGDLSAARQAAVAIADHYRDGRLAPPALLLAATLASRSGDEALAQALLVRLVESYPDAAELPEALYLLGMVGEARGQLEPAALAYRELTVLAPATGYAEAAGDRLAALAAAGVRLPQLSLAQRIDRAERLLRGGVPALAADEAERVAGETGDAGITVRALRVVSDAAAKLGRYGMAARALGLALGRVPASQKPGLQLEHGRLLDRAGERERALAAFAAVEATGAEAEAAEAAYARARLLDELGREAEAVGAYQAVVLRYPARAVAGAALWRLGWLAYLSGDRGEAEQDWTRLADLPGGRAYRIPALYWAGRAREETAGREAAERLYGLVLGEAPRSYYGVLAARRVAAPGESQPQPAIRLPAAPLDALAGDAGFARADLLRRIGLVEFAWQELEGVVQASLGDPVRLYGLSSAYVREERYHLALRILRRHFAGLAATGHPGLPQAFWEMLYPFGWRAEVTGAAGRAGLDPYFVAAVVREESSYHARAVSRAGARGLMQLMPSTARVLTENRGQRPGPGGDFLEDPGINLQLGTRFLATLLKEFGDPALALAAYNAGPKRLRQWWRTRRTGDDVEAFVEQIPYDETRHFVKRVLLSWDEYRRIYAGR